MAIVDASWHRRDQGTGVASQMAGRGCGTRWERVSPSSKEDEAVRERRERLVAVVADIRYGVMSPVVLVAIRETGVES
jgi:hypothetical protein